MDEPFSPAEVKCRRWKTFLRFHCTIYHYYNTLYQELIKTCIHSVWADDQEPGMHSHVLGWSGFCYLQHSMPVTEMKGINPLNKFFPFFHLLRPFASVSPMPCCHCDNRIAKAVLAEESGRCRSLHSLSGGPLPAAHRLRHWLMDTLWHLAPIQQMHYGFVLANE